MWYKALGIFSGIWIGLIVIIIVISGVGTIATNGLWQGILNILGWFNPFNLAGCFINLLVMSPAIFSLYLREKYFSC